MRQVKALPAKVRAYVALLLLDLLTGLRERRGWVRFVRGFYRHRPMLRRMCRAVWPASSACLQQQALRLPRPGRA